MESKAHWDSLLKAAHAKSQPVIVDFGAPWCGGRGTRREEATGNEGQGSHGLWTLMRRTHSLSGVEARYGPTSAIAATRLRPRCGPCKKLAPAFDEVAGAYVASGALIFLLFVTGILRRALSLVPQPVVMAMVAGVFLPFVLRLITSFEDAQDGFKIPVFRPAAD